MTIIFFWLILSFGVAYLGDSRRIGFGWALFWSLLLSPLIGFAVVMVSERKGSYEEELARIQGKPKEPPAPAMKPEKTVVEKLEQLKGLYDSGALSEEEYNKAKARLLD